MIGTVQKIILVAIAITLLLTFNRCLRSAVLHPHVTRFFLIVLCMTFLAVLVIAGYFGWKYWWPVYMAQPRVEWHDTTLEQELNPVTPGVDERSSAFRLAEAVKLILPSAYAQESTEYELRPDAVNAGGADVSKSNTYLLSDSIGEPVVGHGESADYILDSGYRQPSASEFLAMTCSPLATIGTVEGTGQKTGSGTCTVTTDAYSGYNLSWSVLTGSGGTNTGSLINPDEDIIDPFTPAISNTPETWSVGASAAEWGARLRSISTDIAAEWGTDASSEKWLNVRTSARTIVTRSAATPLAGSTEIIQFRAEVGSSVTQPTGVYQTTVTFTVVGF